MAENRLVSFSLVFLAAATVVLFAGQAQGIDICGEAEYVPLCRSVVKGVSDPAVAIVKAIENLSFETKRARAASVKMENKQAINVCNQNYDSAIDGLEQALKYLKSNDKASLRVMLSGALSFYVSCSDAVLEVTGFGVVKMVSEIMKTDTMLKQLASNCLHIASLLK